MSGKREAARRILAASSPPPAPPRPAPRVVRVTTGEVLTATIVSRACEVRWCHYGPDKAGQPPHSVGCKRPHPCEWCTGGVNPYWQGFLAVQLGTSEEQVCLAVTANTAYRLDSWRKIDLGFRGLVIRLRRVGMRANSPVYPERLHCIDPATMPDAIDLSVSIARLLGNPDPVEIGGAR